MKKLAISVLAIAAVYGGVSGIVKYGFAKGGNQRYKCKQCGKVFNNRKSRENHKP
ncbi:MAG: hypothetical protein LBT03_00405 [Holosporales bacterium]|nr:hypothetical protein [Holosporales bacterium]